MEDYQLEWTTLGDGSSFAKTSGMGDFETAVRCWEGTGEYAGFQRCIGISKDNSVGGIDVGQMTASKLPEVALPSGSYGDGYGCGSVLGRFEEITRSGDMLVSNRDAPWTKGFVQTYMEENEVKGAPWFPCLKILDAVQSGSLASLGTTSVTREMAGY